jgi:hypothetical protein
MRGLGGEQRRVRPGLVVATQHVPRFRALLAGGNTPTSRLVLYYEHMVATMVLLELCCLEEEED